MEARSNCRLSDGYVWRNTSFQDVVNAQLCSIGRWKYIHAWPISGGVTTMGTLAMLSNFIFLVTMAKHSSLRKTSLSVYLMTLSVVDICQSLCFTLPAVQHLHMTLKGFYFYTDATNFTTRPVLHPLSVCLMIAISIDRYLAVSKPIQRAAATRGPKIYCLASGICIAAIGYTLKVVIDRTLLCQTFLLKCHNDSKVVIWQKTLEFIQSLLKRNTVYVFFSLNVSTMTIPLLLTVMTYQKLRDPLTVGRAYGGTQHQKVQRNLLKMSVINTSFFFTCIFFSDSYYLLCIIFKWCSQSYLIHFLIDSLPLVNSGINPIIYNVFGTSYRKAFLETFSHLWCLKHRGNREVTSRQDGGPTIQATTQF